MSIITSAIEKYLIATRHERGGVSFSFDRYYRMAYVISTIAFYTIPAIFRECNISFVGCVLVLACEQLSSSPESRVSMPEVLLAFIYSSRITQSFLRGDCLPCSQRHVSWRALAKARSSVSPTFSNISRC